MGSLERLGAKAADRCRSLKGRLSHYLVAQPRLVQALRVSLEPAGGSAVEVESVKRPCHRPLEGGG